MKNTKENYLLMKTKNRITRRNAKDKQKLFIQDKIK